MRFAALSGIGLLALAVAACATPPSWSPTSRSSRSALVSPSQPLSPEPSSSPEPTASPSATAASGPEIPGLLVCEDGDSAVSSNVLREPANAERQPDLPALALRAFVATPEAASLELPTAGWRRVAVSAQSVTFLAHGPAGWVTATITQGSDGTWQFFEGGGCPLHVKLPPELGFGKWRTDPARPVTADDLWVAVLVTELSCASGKPPLGRLLPPVVLATADAVTIAVAIRKLPGSQDCPSNPEAPVVIQLAEPLAGRRLFDGSTFPAAPRT